MHPYLQTRKLPLLMAFIYFAAVLVLLLNRFWQYEVFYYDHGYAESAAYQASQFKNPQWDREGRSSVFVDHFYPSLIAIFAPFYWLSDSYLTPIVILAFLYGLSVLIAWEIGHALKINKLMLYVLTFALMFFIGTQNAVIFFLKDISAATPFFLLMLLFLTKRSVKLYYLFLLISLGFKETLAVTTFALGLATLLFFEKKWRPHALATMIISVIYSLFVTRIIIPSFMQQSFGTTGSYAFRPDLSRSIPEYLINFINNPVKRETISVSLLSFGLLPLVSPIGIILALQDFAQRFVLLHIGNPFRWGLNLHYNINLAVVLFYSSLLSVAWLQKFRWYKKIVWIHTGAIFLIIVIFHHQYHGPFGLLINPEFYRITKKMQFMDDFIRRIPHGGKIMVQNNMAVRFTHEDYYLLSTVKYLDRVKPDVVAIDFRPGQNLNNFWPATDMEVKKMFAYLENSPQYFAAYKEDKRRIYLKKNDEN